MTKPARRYIAEPRRHPDGGNYWAGLWAFPGMVPAYVEGPLDHRPVIYPRKEAATLAAKVTLANALLARVTDTDKPERYQFMAPNDFAGDLKEAGLTATQFARLYGTTQENVVNGWIEGLKPVPHPARVLLRLFLRHPETVAMAEEVTAQSTTPRDGFAETARA